MGHDLKFRNCYSRHHLTERPNPSRLQVRDQNERLERELAELKADKAGLEACLQVAASEVESDLMPPCRAAKDTIELMNKSPQNFERLVLICMDSYDSESRRILQHFSRSTRFAFLCTAQISNFQQKNFVFFFFAFFRKISRKFSKFCHFSAKF